MHILGDIDIAISVAYTRVASKYPAFAAEHEGVKVLGLFTHGPGGILNTKRPIVKAEDLRGLKWRVSGGASNDVAKALGMNATLKPGPESYELLSNGVMDGTLFAVESFASFKLEKIVRHATFIPGGLFNTSFVFMMNKAKFDELPAPDRAAIEAASGEPAARIFGRHWDRVDREGAALMKANGVQVVKADAAFVSHV